jgi:hypothetical protein
VKQIAELNTERHPIHVTRPEQSDCPLWDLLGTGRLQPELESPLLRVTRRRVSLVEHR